EMGQPAVGERNRPAKGGRIPDESDLVAKSVFKIAAFDADPVLPEELLEADIKIARSFGLQRRIPDKGRVGAERLDQGRGFDAFTIIEPQSRRPSTALQSGMPEDQERRDLRHHFGPESDLAGVRLRAEIAENLRQIGRDSGAIVFDANSDGD